MSGDGVASIGECMLELSGSGNDTWRMNHAGDTFNMLWAMRALLPERPMDFVSAFGDDTFSAGQRAFFNEAGIGTAASPVIVGARPGLYAITLDGAERSFTYWRSDSAARRLADSVEKLEKSLENRSLVYFSGITLAILDGDARARLLAAVANARSDGARIAFDPNYRPRLWDSPETAQEVISAALSLTDIALPTFPDEQMLYGDAAPRDTIQRLQQAGIAEIVVKDGAEAAYVSASDATETVPAVNVAKPVDTTGAGDSFNGAYLAARLLDHPPAEAAARAHRVAAEVVQTPGALAPFEALQKAFRV